MLLISPLCYVVRGVIWPQVKNPLKVFSVTVAFPITFTPIYRLSAATCTALEIEMALLTLSPVRGHLCFFRAAYLPLYVKIYIYI